MDERGNFDIHAKEVWERLLNSEMDAVELEKSDNERRSQVEPEGGVSDKNRFDSEFGDDEDLMDAVCQIEKNNPKLFSTGTCIEQDIICSNSNNSGDLASADNNITSDTSHRPNRRFPVVDEEEMTAIEEGAASEGTKKQTKWGVKLYRGAIHKSQYKISGSISCDTQYHFQLETQNCICTPNEGNMHVLASTYWTDATQQAISLVLGIPNNKVSVEVKRLGGSFGSGISRNFPVSTACALAAHIMNKLFCSHGGCFCIVWDGKPDLRDDLCVICGLDFDKGEKGMSTLITFGSERPVRLSCDFSVNMDMLGKRIPHKATYQVGFQCYGILNGVKIKYYTDCGCHSNESLVVSPMGFGDNAYHCLNWSMEQFAIRTNTPSTAYTRGPGSTPGIFIMETIMEHVAKELQMDPFVVKYHNLYRKGQITPSGMPLKYCNIRELVMSLVRSASLVQRKHYIESFNQNNRWKKKGLSVVPVKYGVLWTGYVYNCYVTIYNGDGTVVATHGGIESGQGINTKVAQVCAFKLGIPLDLITVKSTNTLTGANSTTTGGSVTSELCCQGIVECCNKLNSVIRPVREKMGDPTWKELIREVFYQGLDLTARYWSAPSSRYDFQYNTYAVVATEVDLDVLTGENQINRVDILFDCGQSMSPEVDIGQVEGAFVMGLGYWLTETIAYDPETGRNLTNRVWTYHPPTSQDIPIDFRIQLLKNAPNPLGVLSSKACGEPPLTLSCSAVFALKHAIEAARKEIGQDVYFPLDGPATVEILQSKCILNKSQFILEPEQRKGH